MPRIRWSRRSKFDLLRLHSFLAHKNPEVAQRAILAIKQGLKILGRRPEIGRTIENLPPEFREWVIEFGNGSYLTRYQYDGKQVTILAIRHGREDGF